MIEQTISTILATAETGITRPANTTAYSDKDLIAGADQTITGTVAASKVITGISDTDAAKLKVGMYIYDGSKIPADSYITEITLSGSDNNSITFANAAGTDGTAGTVTITARQVVLRFDLSTNNAHFQNGGEFELNEVEISDTAASGDSIGVATAGTQLALILFNSMPYPTVPADNSALNLEAAELLKRTTGATKITEGNSFTSSAIIKQVDIARKAHAETGTKYVYGLLQVGAGGYTPSANSNILTPTIKGTRLT